MFGLCLVFLIRVYVLKEHCSLSFSLPTRPVSFFSDGHSYWRSHFLLVHFLHLLPLSLSLSLSLCPDCQTIFVSPSFVPIATRSRSTAAVCQHSLINDRHRAYLLPICVSVCLFSLRLQCCDSFQLPITCFSYGLPSSSTFEHRIFCYNHDKPTAPGLSTSTWGLTCCCGPNKPSMQL